MTGTLCGGLLRPRFISRQRKLRAFGLSAALLFACVWTSCHRRTEAQAAVTVEHEITPQPARVGTATITLKVADGAQKEVKGAHITVEGDMSHAGMAPVFAEAKETSPGQYQAPMNFSMGGDWVVLLHITLPGGQKVEQQFDVNAVRSD
ncbi:MAG TPA: FixH family protein [Blastocatellia bacterium]|nr:FixH family protein [Blastocatellia bacterium]